MCLCQHEGTHRVWKHESRCIEAVPNTQNWFVIAALISIRKHLDRKDKLQVQSQHLATVCEQGENTHLHLRHVRLQKQWERKKR